MSTSPFLSLTLVKNDEEAVRLDRFLALEFPTFSRQHFQDLIEKNGVLVNEKVIEKKFFLVKAGDRVSFASAAALAAQHDENTVLPESIYFSDLYEDEHILIINKPAGMTVHPGAGNYSGTVANGLKFRFIDLNNSQSPRPGIVHRLDKDTSGVLLTAKTEEAVTLFSKLFSDRLIKKTYIGITSGYPKTSALVINAPIARHPIKRKEMQVNLKKGKSAETCCQLLASSQYLGLLKINPITGRTHQIRVHLKHSGLPILGDSVYGMISTNRRFKATRQLLHAAHLEFCHPITKKIIQVSAPIPSDMQSILTAHFSPLTCVF
ncbi:Ribosomal large subunit pseudouridine synthase D [Candidatus Clavichlamydia salmonicola]|uniref:RluA family pseudouridine synthase n=1 Tax=Candidatus Clavichlamydia salmonicola TaxID=469812 RepID=UPI001891138F|nr:RluA family pseudouridine synthase [Candidatus Clavichlamydia salmonicola]MBF5050661.1 Ribosomal large subunit pseudouridine synthase D [Candidatus Clavichlamydia salmonicola]